MLYILKFTRIPLASILFIAFLSCSKAPSEQALLGFENVIPKPISAVTSGGRFMLTNETKIVVDEGNPGADAIAEYLADILQPATGFNFSVLRDKASDGSIYLTTSGGDSKIGDEGYELTITEDQIRIVANKPAGLFYGVQTLRQLLPAKIEESTIQQEAWEIATGVIRDQPEYIWRGSMLDVARHFFSVEDVKRYIDLISFYKMNILHLHLSDDQGWRIEIKSWPNLTAIGGSTQVGGGKGGYYTQEQYKDIVAYAQSRFITIVPEIDLPGHINAALASYPELNPGPSIKREAGPARPVPGKIYTGIEVGFSTLSLKKPTTFKFVDDVLRELAAITPGPYLHIGGDEAAVTKKEDYIVFINKFKDIVEAQGKKMIGWEEIAQASIDSSIIVQHWHSEAYAKMAATKGSKMVLSPSKKIYLDMKYDSTTKLGLHWAAFIEVDSSYMWDPSSHIDGIKPEQILGVEAPLWSETIETIDDIEYLLFPRLPGVAEIGWTRTSDRNWETYKQRVAYHGKRWKIMGIDYYPSKYIPW